MKLSTMVMGIRDSILRHLRKNGKVTVAELVRATGLSRAYINRILKALREDGRVLLVGKANQAHYILASKTAWTLGKTQIRYFRRNLSTKNLSEDLILAEIKRSTGIFMSLPENTSRILEYGFTEMLNNAIEHSRSKQIKIQMHRDAERVWFEIRDYGIGIFKHIMKKMKLKNELEAIQDLLKGKQTTAPDTHTGEGIFFTSRAVDRLLIKSGSKKLIFDNRVDDIFIDDIRQALVGTQVNVEVDLSTGRQLTKIFQEYAGDSFEFSKTMVVVKLYKMGSEYISRSQARRILTGLEKFKRVVLDFRGVQTVGQGFADEIFRVWQREHHSIVIEIKHANPNVQFMINRARPQ